MRSNSDFGQLSRAAREALHLAADSGGRLDRGQAAPTAVNALVRAGFLHRVEEVGPHNFWWEMPGLVTADVALPLGAAPADLRWHRGDDTTAYRVYRLPIAGCTYVVTETRYTNGRPDGRPGDPYTSATLRTDDPQQIRDWVADARARHAADGWTFTPTGPHPLADDPTETTRDEQVGSVTVRRVYHDGRMVRAELYMGAGWLRATVKTERGIQGAAARLNA